MEDLDIVFRGGAVENRSMVSKGLGMLKEDLLGAFGNLGGMSLIVEETGDRCGETGSKGLER